MNNDELKEKTFTRDCEDAAKKSAETNDKNYNPLRG